MIMIAMAEPMRSRFFDDTMLAELADLGEVVISPTPDDQLSPAVRPLLAEADVIITGWGSGRIDADVLAVAPRLRGVVHTAGSVRAYLSADCYDRGVVVSSQARANAVPVADYTLAMILLTAKGVFAAEHRYRGARCRFDIHAALAGRGGYGLRIGLIGASMVGRRVLDLLSPFDFRIALADPTLTAAEATELGAELMSLDELMSSSEIVSLHAPWLPSTEGMIGPTQLGLLRDGATFINTARGALVDQLALIAELQTGRIEAVLDVTWPEVPEPGSPLWELPNLTLTPHIAGSSGNELRRMGAAAVRETARVIGGEPLHHGVDRDRYDQIA